jgi:HicB-like protein involved in pilus formation
MHTTTHIEALQADLAAAAGVGDSEAMRVAERLAQAIEPALRLRLLDVLSEAALELNGQLHSGRVDVRLAGRDVEMIFTEGSAEQSPAVDDDQAARITLRLPESLKQRAESAAAGEAISLNTWLVRATSRALDQGGRSGGRGPGSRLTGFADS